MKKITLLLIFLLLSTMMFADSETLFQDLDATDSVYLAIASLTLGIGAVNAFVAVNTMNQFQVNDFEIAITVSVISLFISYVNFTYAFGLDNRDSELFFTFIHLKEKPYPKITLDLRKFAYSSLKELEINSILYNINKEMTWLTLDLEILE